MAAVASAANTRKIDPKAQYCQFALWAIWPVNMLIKEDA